MHVSVAKADPKKTVPRPATRLVRELFRASYPPGKADGSCSMSMTANTRSGTRTLVRQVRAFVRDNNDPERLGRLRMEIPPFWARAGETGPNGPRLLSLRGNDDTGMFLVPEEGASVLGGIRGRPSQYPIWSGGLAREEQSREQPEEAKRLCDEAQCRTVRTPKNTTSRRTALSTGSTTITRPSIARAARSAEDGGRPHHRRGRQKTAEEFLKIIERADRSSRMLCPVKPESQAGNSLPRRTRDAVQATSWISTRTS
jgi:hypothetical protein